MNDKELQKKIRRFDAKVLQILLNVSVSAITTILLLYAAGIVP